MTDNSTNKETLNPKEVNNRTLEGHNVTRMDDDGIFTGYNIFPVDYDHVFDSYLRKGTYYV